MPIRPRGELPDPRITAVRDSYSRPASTTITTDVYIELSIDAPNCQLYFTTDGSRPVPFKRWMGTREVTFHYRAPFALKSGKRVVRAVAVSSDKLLESKVVSKTFVVHGDDYDDTIDSDLYSDDEYTSHAADLNWDSTARNRGRTRHSYTSDSNWDSDTTCRSPARQTWVPCKSWTKGRRQSRSLTRPTSAGEPEWIASTRRYPYLVETVDDEPPTGQTICWSIVDSFGYPPEIRERRVEYRRVPSIPSTTRVPRSTCGELRRAACGQPPRVWSPTPQPPPPPRVHRARSLTPASLFRPRSALCRLDY